MSVVDQNILQQQYLGTWNTWPSSATVTISASTQSNQAMYGGTRTWTPMGGNAWQWTFEYPALGTWPLHATTPPAPRPAPRRPPATDANLLTEAERQRLVHDHHLDVRSRFWPHRVYRIPQYSGSMVVVRERGRERKRLCLQPAGSPLPDTAWTALQKLLLESDEQAYLEQAIHWEPTGPANPNYRERDLEHIHSLQERSGVPA